MKVEEKNFDSKNLKRKNYKLKKMPKNAKDY